MIINGANIGEKNVEYKKLSDINWSTIPGGIPSMLINGICVKNNNYTEEELDEISHMYPNATIFDSNKKVLRSPLISESKEFIDEKTI